MKRRAVATAAMAAVLLLAGVAHAESKRVVVAAREADPIANGLQKELTAMGFEAVRVDDSAGCSKTAIAGWIEEKQAAGAACSDGSTVGIWVVGTSGLRMADVVSPQDDGNPSPDLLALRAAEVTRATLELPGGDPPTPAPAKGPPTWTTTPSAAVADTAQKLPPPKVAPPRTPVAAFGMGIAAIMGADATAPGIDLEFEVRVARFLAVSTRAELPLQSTSIPTPTTNVKIAPAVFAIGPSVPLASPDSFFIPRLGTGIGFVWLKSAAEARSSSFASSATNGSFSSTTTPQNTDDLFSPLLYANATASIRVAGPFRLAFDALIGSTAHRLVVRNEAHENIAYWGQPFGTLAMRAELMFP